MNIDKQLSQYIDLHNNQLGMRSNMKDFYYQGIYDFLEKEGKFYKSQELTEEEKKYVMKFVGYLGFTPKYKQCYYNSQLLATCTMTKSKIKYVEGLAVGHTGIPAWHGWNTINGKVIDITWAKEKFSTLYNAEKEKIEDKIFGTFIGSYFGVEIDVNYIRKIMIKDESAHSLIEDWENKFPLLKQKYNAPSI